jgi:integrase
MEPLIFSKALTSKSVEQAKPASVRREIPDGMMRGLYLVIYPSGKKGWAVRYRHKGKPRKLTLDPYPVLALAVARERARDVLLEAGRGRDPAAEKKAAKLASKEASGQDRDLFKNVLADFLKRHASKNRSAAETERLFLREVLPAWGERRIQEIGKRDVNDLLDRIVDRGRGTTANRTLAAIRRLFNWTVERDILSVSPCAGVRPPSPEISRDRILSDDEIRWLWQACEAVAFPFGPLVKLLLVTAQRKEEVGGLTYKELALGHASPHWIIPAARAKNGREQFVPLSNLAVEIINATMRIAGAPGYVFTTTGATRVSGYSRAKRTLDREMLRIARAEAVVGTASGGVVIPHWTFHDLRRTAASGMARLAQPIHVVEAVLNHKKR